MSVREHNANESSNLTPMFRKEISFGENRPATYEALRNHFTDQDNIDLPYNCRSEPQGRGLREMPKMMREPNYRKHSEYIEGSSDKMGQA